MGDHDVRHPRDAGDVRAFTLAVLRDVAALELMIERGDLEATGQRIGVEQEMYLVGPDCRAYPRALEVIDQLSDPRFTTELARFNLEANFDPVRLEEDVFETLERDMRETVSRASHAAKHLGGDVLLTGILPTLRAEDLSIDHLTPELRYRLLNDALLRSQGRITVVIDGLEQYEGTYDSVMLQAANTSLQIHLQVDPHESGRLYNLAQLITAPLLAVAGNSPVLLGRRLWHETRIAVFERALDTRTDSQLARGSLSRVTFGDAWLHDSIVEVFRDNLARFPVFLTRDTEGDSVEQAKRGERPQLRALGLYNSTVWRWNRPCYGVTDGRPHLRIECRVLPSGPTVLDEVANAAFFYGMMLGLSEDYADVSAHLDFGAAKTNFLAAAKLGLRAEFAWLDGRSVVARDLVLKELLPAAHQGLGRVRVPASQIDRYLGTIEARVRGGRTGSNWLLETFNAQRTREPYAVWHDAVKTMLVHQISGTPVHEWPVSLDRQGARVSEPTVGDIMTRNVFTVSPDDVIDLATSVMEWKHVRHIPVESASGELLGLITARELLGARDKIGQDDPSDPVSVGSLMRRDMVQVPAATGLTEAMRISVKSNAGCLLVVERGKLVGIVTEHDLVAAASRALGTIP
jgi:CBS domain-containing protein